MRRKVVEGLRWKYRTARCSSPATCTTRVGTPSGRRLAQLRWSMQPPTSGRGTSTVTVRRSPEPTGPPPWSTAMSARLRCSFPTRRTVCSRYRMEGKYQLRGSGSRLGLGEAEGDGKRVRRVCPKLNESARDLLKKIRGFPENTPEAGSQPPPVLSP